MPPVSAVSISGEWTPILTAAGIILVAVFLGLWQWFDRRARDPETNEADREFFRLQDGRRWVGIIVMGVLAVAIAVVPAISSWIPPSAQRIWPVASLCGLVGLILALLSLALLDAMATWRYARRHRRELAKEHAKLMLDVITRAGSSDSIRRVPAKKSEASEV